MSKAEFITRPAGVHQPPGNALSHAVVADSTVYISGQLGLTEDGLLVDGFEGQATQAFENLRAVLKAADAELTDIVKVTVLLTDRSNVRAYMPLAHEFLPQRPASTLQVVAGLAMPGLLFEIDAIARRSAG
ncbi:RidA family protein [Streptomyces sp. ADI93-02]|uniref:RidA family protein n=1 Tax=Streptomyces sp. ADI93-02 TaxID=1522757 RepID=UPI000F5527DF|nr:RidA family protein [Streptomyces sp. ADI93-02]RPK33553.1 RutC family protein YjgH [Streptomyces sp. ADI93-02]